MRQLREKQNIFIVIVNKQQISRDIPIIHCVCLWKSNTPVCMQICFVLTHSSHIQAFSAASLPLISTSAAPLNWQLLVNLQEIAATHLSDNPRKVLLCKETLELKKITYQ